jgi:predicted dehydrogenase
MKEHGKIAKAALLAGKHVLVEKLMAISMPEAEDLLKLGSDRPGHLIVAPFILLNPSYREIGNRIRRGDIGKVCLSRSQYGHGGPDWGPWFYRLGGGAIFDLAVYSLTALTGWFGPVRAVTALAGVAIDQRQIEGTIVTVEAEDNAQILVDFGESHFASITAGFTMQKCKGPGYELYGSLGTVRVLGDNYRPRGYEIWLKGDEKWRDYPDTGSEWNWTAGLDHVIQCMLKGKQPEFDSHQAFHVLEIMVKAKQAAMDGKTYGISSSFPIVKF